MGFSVYFRSENCLGFPVFRIEAADNGLALCGCAFNAFSRYCIFANSSAFWLYVRTLAFGLTIRNYPPFDSKRSWQWYSYSRIEISIYNVDFPNLLMEVAMESLPEKTCSIERLVTQAKLVAAAKAGIKTQQRRDGVYAWPGESFELEGMKFIVTDLSRQRLGDMTDEDAKAEGFPGLASYKEIILKMHAGMTWNEDGLVWVHSFAAQSDA